MTPGVRALNRMTKWRSILTGWHLDPALIEPWISKFPP